MSYKGLYFEYVNEVTSTQESFIIQKIVGRDKWPFLDINVILEAYISDFTKYSKSKNGYTHKQKEMTENSWVDVTSLAYSKYKPLNS